MVDKKTIQDDMKAWHVDMIVDESEESCNWLHSMRGKKKDET